MKRYFILGVLLLATHLLRAQKHYAIMVNDSKNPKPVAGATIKILSTGETVTTGESGNAVMLISPTDSLLITAKGFKDRKLMMEGQFVAITVILDSVPPKPAVKLKPGAVKNR
jgi:hypothetical protein